MEIKTLRIRIIEIEMILKFTSVLLKAEMKSQGLAHLNSEDYSRDYFRIPKPLCCFHP